MNRRLIVIAASILLLVAGGSVAALLASSGGDEEQGADASQGQAGSATATAPTTENPEAPSTRPTSYPEDNYTFVVSRLCECVDGGVRIAITVEDGKPVDARYVQKGYGHQAGEQVSEKYLWITLDDVIDLANTKRADDVTVVWPDGQDYPKTIYVDYDFNVADEEVSYVVYRVSTGVTDRPGHLRGDASSVR
jgi:hypothetical protein